MDGEARHHIKKERGLVLKVDGEGVVIGRGKELDTLGDSRGAVKTMLRRSFSRARFGLVLRCYERYFCCVLSVRCWPKFPA